MKVGTKLALGAALAVLPMTGGLAYAVSQVRALSVANVRTVESQQRAAQLALRVLRGIELAGEYDRKLQVTHDGGYRDKLDEVRSSVTASIHELSALSLSPAEEAATDALTVAWAAPSDGTEDARRAASRLLEENRVALEAHAGWAEEESRKTQRLALAVALAALAASALVIVFLVRSLQQPLRQLTRGTRAVAKGDFEFRAVPMARDELGEVTEAFNHMVDSLGALERVKAELISRVSHELRTPLVAMVETNRLLLDEIPGPINARQRRILELHAGAAERLTVMIRDLLDLSALEANPSLERELVDLVPLTREVVDQLAPLANEQSLHLDVGFSVDSAIVRGDARRYQQVVQNL
ncbi:MAG: HAMP domain-containing histidine kinase, partial [Myxococcales bacterium]|nr:HAMP domain-containing histidine kinase [Myxococcales bacterium]